MMSWRRFRRAWNDVRVRPWQGMTPEEREEQLRQTQRLFWFPTQQLFDPLDPPPRRRSEDDSG
jgi:hypothetical protein